MYKSTVGLREAKANLSRLVKEVQLGKEIILTERGKPVAKLTPIKQQSLSLKERLNKLEQSGWLVPLQKNKSSKVPTPLPLPGQKAQELLQEDRNK